ncbi:AAA family ATPase [Vibrio parahaemolyticus]|nr:AAA family ATPase [Vibrio parahaemolyticus]HCG7218181.1 AAA family ATPase [Vibrio parahaemolyticus]
MSNLTRQSRSIRSLITNSRKGNLFSAIQLSEYYRLGRFVKQDQEKSEKFKQIAFDIFSSQKLEVSELKLSNYRAFNEIHLKDFDSNLNVFIGNNGSGKTTILDAIHLSLSWLSTSINKSGGNGEQIDETDINIFYNAPYATVSSEMTLNKDVKAILEVSKSKDGYAKVKSKLAQVKAIGGFYKVANEINPEFNMPLLAYYNVMRSYDVNPKDLKETYNITDASSVDKFDAYQRSLTGKTDFNSFFRWFKKLTDIANSRSVDKEKNISSKAKALLDDIENVHGKNSEKYRSALELFLSMTEDNTSNEQESNSSLNQFDIIDNVISSFMDGYGNIQIQLEPNLDLLIEKGDRKISVLRLSQGEKTLLALVLDIARRLIVLNPSLQNPLEGNGVVLIDEFDLHLHPLWQKSFAKNLCSTFPNVQFFLTTHSPLVLSEVKYNHVYIIEENDEQDLSIIRPEQTYGLSSSQVLDDVMNFQDLDQISRPSMVHNKIERISDLIDEETEEALNQAQSLINELKDELNGDIPELVKEQARLYTISAWLEDDRD